MNSEFLRQCGIPQGKPTQTAFDAIKALFASGLEETTIREQVAQVAADPSAFEDDARWGTLAHALINTLCFAPRESPAPWVQWGEDLDANSIEQMKNAVELPIAVRGALMPDAHLGYGLPIGGVLATRNAIVPYAVGVDIACRMKLTVLDLPVSHLDEEPHRERLINALRRETQFGTGSTFKAGHRRKHAVMDQDWDISPLTRNLKDKAWAQLGTSGSGNHFVEYGELTFTEPQLGMEAGTYLAVLSHSGSRGSGATIAGHYSKLAKQLHPELPNRLSQIAWLDMDSSEGQEYFAAMNLMGDYAAANHACIHEAIADHLGVEVRLDVENHHNFAWKEIHDGEELYVHRKGATPAGEGILGIIPGSMASAAYIVRGKGNAASLNSASHGAGRVMSRTRAKRELNWADARKLLTERRVHLMSAGLDEVPMVYKDIEQVMDAQTDLVDKLARFVPRIVRMAKAGERPED